MWQYIFLGIPKITGTMEMFDSYAAINAAYSIGKTE